MIIKLLEQPIIAIHEAEIAGTVDGVVIKGNKISCIYHRNMENHFAIPVENAIIGSDAVMIQDVTAMTPASQNTKSLKSMVDVYNISGKHLGCLHGIETDDELVVQYIYTEDYRIEISKIVNYESVIVVDAEEAELEASSPEHFFGCCQEDEVECLEEEAADRQVEDKKAEAVISENVEEDLAEEEAAISMEIGPEIKWNDDNHQRSEKNPANSELSVVRAIHQNEEMADIPGVDSKYAYLYGKQLLEDIDIEDTFYEKGTIISADMIKHAIMNNAIVKLIVNAED